MQLSPALLSLVLAATSVQAASIPFIGSQVAIASEFKVPGNNPLSFCDDPDKDILTIDQVDLTPNPPEAGKKLSISAKGKLSEDVEEGAKVHLVVKWGFVQLINQDADLCENVEKADLECPLKKGDLQVSKDVDLPAQIPPGKYTVLADVTTKNGTRITCLNTEIHFG